MSSMLHAKFQDHQTSGFREEDLLRSSSEDRILRILTRFEIMLLIEHAVMAARLLK